MNNIRHVPSLCSCQWPAASRVHARKASVHGALPAPLLLLQDPRAQTRLRRPLRQRPTLADAHHSGQELPGGICLFTMEDGSD